MLGLAFDAGIQQSAPSSAFFHSYSLYLTYVELVRANSFIDIPYHFQSAIPYFSISVFA